ncbi:hypothetical protein Btru_031174 [Bulinus truncatus]|nr:hypothetical protein Btru_031174 [Bulinus truncatus]
MNAQDWERIQMNWTELLQVHPAHIKSYLYQEDVLTLQEKKFIDSKKDHEKQMKIILLKIKEKPPKKNAYKHFITCLGHDPVDKLIADKMGAANPKSDASLSSKQHLFIYDELEFCSDFVADPHLLDEPVRRVLLEHFASKDGQTTPVGEVRDVLVKAGVFKGECEWDDVTLIEFIISTFTGVTLQAKRKPHGRTMINLGNSEQIEQTVSTEVIEQTVNTEVIEQTVNTEVIEQTVNTEVIEYIVNTEVIEKAVNTEVLEQTVNTDVLETKVNTEVMDTTETVSEERDGQNKATLTAERNNSMTTKGYTTKGNIRKEYFREFDTRVTHTVKYNSELCFDVSRHSGGKKTEPTKNFHLVEDTEEDKALEFIGSELIPFVSACLNDRRNGTIYFGISPDDGKIYGVNIPEEDIKKEILESVKSSFIKNQADIINSILRDPEFVPLISCEADRFVVEIDVVPNTKIMQKEHIFRTKTNNLPSRFRRRHRQSESVVFRFSTEGSPKVISIEELDIYEKHLASIVSQREEEEMGTPFKCVENLRLKLQKLLTGDREQMLDTIFPFLFICPLDESLNSEDSLVLASLIHHLHPEVVFDFDDTSASKGMLNYFEKKTKGGSRIFTLNDFEDNIKKQDFRNFMATLYDEPRCSIRWMLSNGYKESSICSMDPLTWNKERSSTFQKALNYFINMYEKDRIIFIILLISKNYTTMIEACDEALRKLPDSWILLAETEDVVRLWQEEILNRKRASRSDIQDNSVVGLTWEEVCRIICCANDTSLEYCCEIPSSTGALAAIDEGKWHDINVVYSLDLAVKIPPEKRDDERRRIQEKFYGGDEVDWLNFAFDDQVMRRGMHCALLEVVKQALTFPANSELAGVPVFTILHQPGAGGTTSAKQVLWDLRNEFRCCVVLKITKQTSNQIHELRQFKDKNPKPVLVMVDNEDDFEQLRESFVEKNKETMGYGVNRVYCVVIQCIRLASPPCRVPPTVWVLRHELIKKELEWFNEKYTHLQIKYESNQLKHINPDFLIAFNILKENFKDEKINHMVKEFTDSISNALEIKLLKVVSLINAYDPDLTPIPVSCLDTFLKQNPINKKRSKQGIRPLNWEASLSEAVKVLLNISRRQARLPDGTRFIKVFHKIFAQKILANMKEKTGESESQIMREILDLEIFQSGLLDESFNSDGLLTKDAMVFQKILNNIFKNREIKKDLKRRRKFSEFVSHVEMTESSEAIVKLMERLFSCNNDPFTAQLIARFYIQKKEWAKAEKFAELSTTGDTQSSYLWDTLGQIYKCQIADKCFSEKKFRKLEEFQESDIHDLIALSEKSLNAFRKGQLLSEIELPTSYKSNLSGYFGELRTITLLLSALSLSNHFKDKNSFHRYLVESDYKLPNDEFLSKNESELLKSLESCSRHLICHLEIHLCHLETAETLPYCTLDQTEFNRNELNNLKVNLLDFFGEWTEEIPEYYNDRDRCNYRLRLARRIGASSLSSLLRLRNERKIETQSKLQNIFDLLQVNAQSECKDGEDLRSMFHIITVLVLERHPMRGINYELIVQWCKEMHFTRNEKKDRKSNLEIYLYYVMYNFPTDERSSFEIAMQADLSRAINEWRDSFKQYFPKIASNGRKKETMVFFLGNGTPLQDLLFFDSSQVLRMYTEHEQWQIPKYRKGLRLFNGILLEGGHSVSLRIHNSNVLIIPTAFPVLKKALFQKKIFFYIGFSISGPKAFGMCLERPEYYEPEPSSPRHLPMPVASLQQEGMKLMELLECLKLNMSKLEETQISIEEKSTLEKERLDLCRKIWDITGEKEQFNQ